MKNERKQALDVVASFCESCIETEPADCTDTSCPFYKIRPGASGSRTLKMIRAVGIKSLIRKRCLECCGDQPREVTNCSVESCPLYEWKSGEYKENSFGDYDPMDDIFS